VRADPPGQTALADHFVLMTRDLDDLSLDAPGLDEFDLIPRVEGRFPAL
jgi:hypothetical protein